MNKKTFQFVRIEKFFYLKNVENHQKNKINAITYIKIVI